MADDQDMMDRVNRVVGQAEEFIKTLETAKDISAIGRAAAEAQSRLTKLRADEALLKAELAAMRGRAEKEMAETRSQLDQALEAKQATALRDINVACQDTLKTAQAKAENIIAEAKTAASKITGDATTGIAAARIEMQSVADRIASLKSEHEVIAQKTSAAQARFAELKAHMSSTLSKL